MFLENSLQSLRFADLLNLNTTCNLMANGETRSLLVKQSRLKMTQEVLGRSASSYESVQDIIIRSRFRYHSRKINCNWIWFSFHVTNVISNEIILE